MTELEFEKPVVELKTKIAELRKFMQDSGIDLSDEVAKLEGRLVDLSEQVYSDLTAWQRVQIARHPHRPTALDYIQGMCESFMELHGDRNWGDDQAIIGGIGLIDGRPVTIIGNQKGRDTKERALRNFGMGNPEGYRKALRLMKQAETFGRPVILLIDTVGAYPGITSEERGISEAIATNLREMAGLRTPTVSFILGEGSSGGALGIGLTDRIYILEYAYYSVISPEGAASILWKDGTQGAKAAEWMKMAAPNVVQLGIADELIPEPKGGAHKDPASMVELVKERVVSSLTELAQLPLDELLQARYDKYRNIGPYSEG